MRLADSSSAACINTLHEPIGTSPEYNAKGLYRDLARGKYRPSDHLLLRYFDTIP